MTKGNLPLPVMMSLDEVAAASGLSVSTVKKACYDGELASKKYGRRRLVPRHAFEEWIAVDPVKKHSDDEELGNHH